MMLGLTLLLAVSSLGPMSTGGEPITCETSGIVQEGSSAHLTCIFHDKLDKTNQGFMVYRHKTDTASELIIALCGWENDELTCRNFDGFTLKPGVNNEQVTFEVGSVQVKHSGSYICKTLPASEAEATSCELTVQKNGVLGTDLMACRTSSPIVLGEEVSVSCSYSKSLGLNGIVLERFNENSGNKDVIAECDKDGKCMAAHGYCIQGQMPTELNVTIPDLSQEQTGIYVCRSSEGPGINSICSLVLSTGSKVETSASFNEMIVPMYAILAVLLLLIALLSVFGLRRLRSRCSTRKRVANPDQKNADNEAPLMGQPEKNVI